MNKLLAYLLIFILFSCTPQRKDDVIVPFKERISLTTNQSKNVGGATKQVTIKVKNVQDSRCPKGVVCVWEGFVNVEFLLSNQAKQQTAFALCLGRCDSTNKSSTLNVLLGAETYKVTLFEVSEGKNARVVVGLEKI